MRLNKFIAHNTKFSRKQADELIKNGSVKINHKIADFAHTFDTNDKIFINGKLIRARKSEQYTLAIYNKNRGEIVSKSDERNRKIIFENLPKNMAHFSYIGRLDYASEGLLILCDNKQIASKLERSKLERSYNLKLNKPLNRELLTALQKILQEPFEIKNKKGAHQKTKIENIMIEPFADVHILKNQGKFPRLRVVINEGKNRELRRFFAQFDYEILDLKRVSFGFCNLNNLPSGKWRYFSKKEYEELRKFLADEKMHSKTAKNSNF